MPRKLGVLLVGLHLAGCQPFAVPGLGPLVGPPPKPLSPEPTACGGNPEPLLPPPAGSPTIVGAADFHNHQFANLGFGGRLLWGKSFDRLGAESALHSCGADSLCLDDRELALCQVGCALTSNPEACRTTCEGHRCADSPPHGHLGATDHIGAGLGQGTGHSVGGFPEFRGWPHYNSYTHQQEYYRWLRRAFEGGLKLIVVLAVSNEVLCELLGHDHACDDMTNVDLQLAEARKLEDFVDWENDCDASNDNGWYRIADSPEHARRIIADGALAVVLGTEVDTLFNCYRAGTCTAASVRAEVQKYQKLGVRHVFPVHLFDNAFGGTAAVGDFFNFGSAVVNRDLLRVEDCSSQGYSFRFGRESTAVNRFLSGAAAHFGIDYPKYPSAGAHCNRRGLEPLGHDAIKALINAKLLIDVDHMSTKTRGATLDILEGCRYPGVLSGHSGFTELYRGHKQSEGQLRPREVERILGLGGVLAPILHQGSRADLPTYRRANAATVENDCGNSAKSFVQAYLYAVDATQRAGRDFTGVGFGSDINGLAGMPAPRFGPYACGGDGVEQAERVRYPITPLKGSVPSLPASQAGYREFDINVDGFAHMGMFPDFVAELRAVGLTDSDLTPLFNSAEAYIRTWEAATRHAGCQ